MNTKSIELSNEFKKVFERPELKAFTTNVYNYDVSENVSNLIDLNLLLTTNGLNYVQYFVQRVRQFDGSTIGGCDSFNYRIQIEYFIQPMCDQNENKIQEFFETLDEIIPEVLGYDLSGLVNGYQGDSEYPLIAYVSPIENRPRIRGQYIYNAYSN